MSAERDVSAARPAYEPPQMLRLTAPRGSARCQEGSGASQGDCMALGLYAGLACSTGETANTGVCDNGATAGVACASGDSGVQV